MKQAELAFKSFLSARRLKYTPERRKILEEIFAARDLFDAEQLLRRLKRHNKRVSRATVYRTLELLARLGLVKRVCFSERTSFYENMTNGPHNGFFQGGIKCVLSPVRRTPVQDSGGDPLPNNCSGTYTYDMNALIQSGVDPALVVGTDVNGQFWMRDPFSPFTTGLTNGIEFQICP